MKKYKNIIIFTSILILLISFLVYFIYFLERKLKDGFTNIDEIQDIQKEIRGMGLEPALGFCEKHRSSGINREEECNKLTKDNCSKTTCCVYINNSKCVAGTANGALYKTKNGEKINVTTFDHNGKCFGNKCKK